MWKFHRLHHLASPSGQPLEELNLPDGESPPPREGVARPPKHPLTPSCRWGARHDSGCRYRLHVQLLDADHVTLDKFSVAPDPVQQWNNSVCFRVSLEWGWGEEVPPTPSSTEAG